MSKLDPIDPSKALEPFLADRGGNLADATIRSHRSRLSMFVTWLADHGIDNLNDLMGVSSRSTTSTVAQNPAGRL